MPTLRERDKQLHKPIKSHKNEQELWLGNSQKRNLKTLVISNSVVVMEMQIKTRMSYDEKVRILSVGENSQQEILLHCWWEDNLL